MLVWQQRDLLLSFCIDFDSKNDLKELIRVICVNCASVTESRNWPCVGHYLPNKSGDFPEMLEFAWNQNRYFMWVGSKLHALCSNLMQDSTLPRKHQTFIGNQRYPSNPTQSTKISCKHICNAS